MVRNSFKAAAALIGQPAWVLFGFALSALLMLLVSRYLIGSGLVSVSPGLLFGLVINALVYGLALLVVLLPMLLRRSDRRQRISRLLGLNNGFLTWSSIGKTLWVFAAYFAATVAVSLIGQFLLSQWINFEEVQEIGIDPANLVHWYEYLLALIMLVVLPPVFEELLFRGYLFGKLRSQFSFWLSTLVTSALFGFVHGQWNVAIDTFVLSLFLCYLRESTGSIWPAVLLHALKNGLAFSLLFIFKIG